MLLDASQPEMTQVCENRNNSVVSSQNRTKNDISNHLISITKQTFQHEILESNQPVILVIYAPWCGPCQASIPVFAELSREYVGKIKFARLNISSENEKATELGVSSVPTFLFYKNGQIVDQHVGSINQSDFVIKIANAFR
jgi:thioredoxin 1